MKLTKCINGHFYDAEKFSTCPHCAGNATGEVSDDSVTVGYSSDMDAGVTLLDGKSGFYGNDTEVVLTILPYRKLPDLKDKIKEIDEKAFIIVSHVEEVSGNGFTYSKEMREASS